MIRHLTPSRISLPVIAALAATPGQAQAFDFLQTMNDGGPFMWLILSALIAGTVLIIERSAALLGKYNANAAALFGDVRERVAKGDIKGAKAVLEAKPNAAVSQVLAAALGKAGQSETAIQDAVEEASLEVIPKLQARTQYLNTIANVSTLMGLLGTILGLIQAFAGLAAADPSQKQTVLASGIAIAMNTTAFGLIAAIPCMVAHAILQGRTNTMIQKIDEYSVKLTNLLAAKSA